MKKILILPLLLIFLAQGSMAQTPKWVEKAKRAVFSVVTYDKNDKMLNTGNGFLYPKTGWRCPTILSLKVPNVRWLSRPKANKCLSARYWERMICMMLSSSV